MPVPSVFLEGSQPWNGPVPPGPQYTDPERCAAPSTGSPGSLFALDRAPAMTYIIMIHPPSGSRGPAWPSAHARSPPLPARSRCPHGPGCSSIPRCRMPLASHWASPTGPARLRLSRTPARPPPCTFLLPVRPRCSPAPRCRMPPTSHWASPTGPARQRSYATAQLAFMPYEAPGHSSLAQPCSSRTHQRSLASPAPCLAAAPLGSAHRPGPIPPLRLGPGTGVLTALGHLHGFC